MWHTESGELQEIMLSCGGRGAGGVWQAMPELTCDWFTSAQFRCATILRLGTLRLPAHTTCNLVRRAAAPTEEGEEKGPGRACGTALGMRRLRPLLCKAGPARMRPHRHLAATLACSLRAAGADVDLGRVIPEPADVNSRDASHHDAVMDTVAFWPGGMATSWVDVSIRCPHVARYTCAHKQAGHAADKAAEEKFE